MWLSPVRLSRQPKPQQLIRGLPQYRSWLASPGWLSQLNATEQYADGLINKEEVRAVRQESGGPYNFFRVVAAISSFSLTATIHSLRMVQQEFSMPSEQEVCNIFHDIFGLFVFSTSLNRSWVLWNDLTVTKIAQAIYDDRAFDRLPILADALEDACCDNADILNHCRSAGNHVRGCWVVDFLLNKK